MTKPILITPFEKLTIAKLHIKNLIQENEDLKSDNQILLDRLKAKEEMRMTPAEKKEAKKGVYYETQKAEIVRLKEKNKKLQKNYDTLMNKFLTSFNDPAN